MKKSLLWVLAAILTYGQTQAHRVEREQTGAAGQDLSLQL